MSGYQRILEYQRISVYQRISGYQNTRGYQVVIYLVLHVAIPVHGVKLKRNNKHFENVLDSQAYASLTSSKH